MMAPAFGVGSPSRTTAQQRTPADYRPGVCNIGPAEIERRRRVGHLGVAATVLLLIGLVVVNAPPIGRLLLVLPAAAAASGYLQAWLKFCAGFGARGVFNFGNLGRTEQVGDAASRARDRAKAIQIAVVSLAIGLLIALAAMLI